jgi:hypothetical protein
MLLIGCSRQQQTTNALTNTSTPSLLTKEQAESLALRLANDKLMKLNSMHLHFTDSDSRASFVAGHWIWTDEFPFAHSLHEATVELASDGSTNSVDVE